MARPDREAIVDTFMSITGVDEAVAIQKLEEHFGDLNEAVNAHFNEADTSITQEASFTSIRDHGMDIDDPLPAQSHRPTSSFLPFARDFNPFSMLDPNCTRSIFDIGNSATRSPFVSHPREVREIPIEVKDGIGDSSGAPTIEDVTETVHQPGPVIRGTVIMDDEDDDVADYGNDIEEEMIRAAIEASKLDASMSNQLDSDILDVRDSAPQPINSLPEDDELAHAVSLSLQENQRQLAAKEASLPQEPTADDENAVTLLLRMPDGNKCERRFLKSDKLQCLFDFIDVGRVVKPGSYRLVRHYPRRVFSDEESTSTLHELGLTSKYEALHLELI
ncbi:hypothetical protein ABFX02_05G096200 [Erythranthe guttata]